MCDLATQFSTSFDFDIKEFGTIGFISKAVKGGTCENGLLMVKPLCMALRKIFTSKSYVVAALV